MKRLTLSAFLPLLLFAAPLPGEEKKPDRGDTSDAFLFGWGRVPAERADTRGGTSNGAPVELAPPVPLPPAGLAAAKSDFERDRAAILAMAGDYRVSFHFLETLGLTEGFEADRPYHSWATERVHVLEDREGFISLQHTLEMHFLDEEGKASPPSLVKHWRQDWTYEDREILDYLGEDTWQKRTAGSDEVKGAWSQAVFQVDDGPRYETLGRWEHLGNLSCWTSDSFLRPLPRREHTVRKDYGVLDGFHRIVLTPTGWLHEQHNWKRVSGNGADPAEELPAFLAAEIGLERYERITSPALDTAIGYWEKTDAYWSIVRRVWSEVLAGRERFQLADKVDGETLYDRLFEPADSIAGGTETFDPAVAEAEIRETITAFVKTAG